MRTKLNSRVIFATCMVLMGALPLPAAGQEAPPPVVVVEATAAPQAVPEEVPPPPVVFVEPSAPPAVVEAPPIELSIVVTSAPAEPIAAPVSEEGEPSSAPVIVDAAVSVDDGPPPEFVPGFVSAGGSVLVGTRPTEDGLSPTWFGGFDLSFRLDRMLSIGVRRVHGGVFGDERYWSVGASPFAELTLTPWERIHFYGQVGVALDVRIASSNAEVDSPSVAPFLGVGARFYFCGQFSLAVEGVGHVPLTGGLAVGESIAPDFAVTLMGGLALAFHFE
jgi:hypothetical protein